jgi:hypothetical protein
LPFKFYRHFRFYSVDSKIILDVDTDVGVRIVSISLNKAAAVGRFLDSLTKSLDIKEIKIGDTLSPPSGYTGSLKPRISRVRKSVFSI